MEGLEQFFIPIVVVFVILAMLVAMVLFSRNYIKVPPNFVAIFSGRKRTLPDGRAVGYRMVKGSASIGEAEASRDAKIRSALALQEGDKAKFDAEANMAAVGKTTCAGRATPSRGTSPS